MSTGARENIFPTRMALTNTKTRLKGAQTGHSLLAKKRDALTTRFRAILRKVDEARNIIDMSRMFSVFSSGKTQDGQSYASRLLLSC
jgi:V-type H+-transporting ATPase subunit D